MSLKQISLILGLTVASTPALAWTCDRACEDRINQDFRHQELMDEMKQQREEIERPRQCFTQRDSLGRVSTWCN